MSTSHDLDGHDVMAAIHNQLHWSAVPMQAPRCIYACVHPPVLDHQIRIQDSMWPLYIFSWPAMHWFQQRDLTKKEVTAFAASTCKAGGARPWFWAHRMDVVEGGGHQHEALVGVGGAGPRGRPLDGVDLLGVRSEVMHRCVLISRSKSWPCGRLRARRQQLACTRRCIML